MCHRNQTCTKGLHCLDFNYKMFHTLTHHTLALKARLLDGRDLRKPRRPVVLGAPATQIQMKNKYFGSWRISLSYLFISSAVKKKMQMHNHFHTEIKLKSKA